MHECSNELLRSTACQKCLSEIKISKYKCKQKRLADICAFESIHVVRTNTTQLYLTHALFRAENISIIQDELEGTTITTVTRKKIFFLKWLTCFFFNELFVISAWITKSINFQFNENFNVEYGENENEGVLRYFCSRPKINTINCK